MLPGELRGSVSPALVHLADLVANQPGNLIGGVPVDAADLGDLVLVEPAGISGGVLPELAVGLDRLVFLEVLLEQLADPFSELFGMLVIKVNTSVIRTNCGLGRLAAFRWRTHFHVARDGGDASCQAGHVAEQAKYSALPEQFQADVPG
jgi:hypothetical protein